MSSKLDQQQITQIVFDAANEALKVVPIGGVLVTDSFDYISAAYPSTTQEVYTYKMGGSGGTTVATITVNYTSATKDNFLNISKA